LAPQPLAAPLTPHPPPLTPHPAGEESRQPCPASYPYTATGSLTGDDPSSSNYICSGTLFRRDRLLTAAHCVYDLQQAAFSQSLDFAPGRYRRENGSIASPYGVHPWLYATLLAGYINTNGSDWDVAVVRLAAPVGEAVGWLGLRASSCVLPQPGANLTVAGYPGDQLEGTCWADTCRATIPLCGSTRMTHTCDTYPGQSGAGIWQAEPGSGLPYIRAVHVRGFAEYNEGTVVTPEIFEQLSAW
jgi:V8-like Glu-specific endopeptidase